MRNLKSTVPEVVIVFSGKFLQHDPKLLQFFICFFFSKILKMARQGKWIETQYLRFFNSIDTETNKPRVQTYPAALNQSSYSSTVMRGSGNSLK